MALIELGGRNFLLYLILPHPLKMALLSEASRARLDVLNRLFNKTAYSGQGASDYDRIHRYAEAEQHDHPCRMLLNEVWAPRGYGRALDVGAGSGYFTAMIARRATSLIALDPVPDMQRALRERCAAEGLRNVEVVGASALDLRAHVPDASVDSALLLQTLHNLHRRDEVFAALGAAVRPGGRLFLVEPHHNVRRAFRLCGCTRPRTAPPRFARTSATGPPTTSSPGGRSVRFAGAADSRTCASPGTGCRSHAGSCRTRAAGSGRSGCSVPSPGSGTPRPCWPSRRAGATGP